MKFLIVLFVVIIIYWWFYFTTVRYYCLMYKTQFIDFLKKLKKSINLTVVINVINNLLDTLQAPFMNYINSRFKIVSKITSFLISFLTFIKEIILFFLKKK